MLPEGYHDFLSEAVRKDREGIMRGGGYKVEEAWERALRSAVAALDLPPQSSWLDQGRDIAMTSQLDLPCIHHF